MRLSSPLPGSAPPAPALQAGFLQMLAHGVSCAAELAGPVS